MKYVCGNVGDICPGAPSKLWFSCSCKSYLVKCKHNHVSPYQLVANSVSYLLRVSFGSTANKKSVSALCYKNPHCRYCVGGKLK